MSYFRFQSELEEISTETNIVVVTKDNVKAALIDSEYYDASDFTGL